MKYYRSSIPKAARERVIALSIKDRKKYKSEYRLNGVAVGYRLFHEAGDVSYEWPIRNGRTHGIVYRSDEPGKLLSAEPFVNGFAHGAAKQYSDDGELIGTCTMKHGTGIDLCRHVGAGKPHLAEARYYKDGRLHGFEWWLNQDQKSVRRECHYWNDQLHGIERLWNPENRMRRGYPKYWIHNQQVTKRQYVRASGSDPTLPPSRDTDNRPRRKFPPEVAAHCMQSNR